MKTLNGCSLLFFVIANISLTALASDESATASDFIPAKIAVGITHSCAMSTKGQVKCWGYNYLGELGIAAQTRHGLDPGSMGPNLPIVDFGTNLYAKDICAGSQSTCVATTDGRIKCWGRNDKGQLGQESRISDIGRQSNEMGNNLPFTDLGLDFKVKSVHCGFMTHCALSETGKLKCWGEGSNGKLGRDIAPKTTIGREKGEMRDQLPVVPLPVPVKFVSVGFEHICAASTSDVYCWGRNDQGQAGVGSTVLNIILPPDPSKAMKVKIEDVATVIEDLSIGVDHTCVLYHLANRTAEQKIKCWGSNADGALGIGSIAANMGRTPDTMGSKLPDTQLALGEISQLETHPGFSCALAQNGKVKCWGRNGSGQLGIGDAKPRGQVANDMGLKLPLVNLGVPVLAISSGPSAWSSCAILINHEIKCWGQASYGTLGYEDNLNRGVELEHMGDNLPYVRYK